MLRKNNFTFYHQLQSTDCGAACLAMILSSYGKKYTLNEIKSLFEFTRIGVSVPDIIDAANAIGLEAHGLKLDLEELEEVPLPLILFWKQDHFVVLENIIINKKGKIYKIADPAYGRISLTSESFSSTWKGENAKGVAIIFNEENINFKPIATKGTDISFFKSFLFIETQNFIRKNKFKYLLSFILILIGLIANWLIPFTFQKLIDTGIKNKSIDLIYFFLLAQFVFFISSFLSDFFSHLILTRINFNLTIALKNNLLSKLMRLPIKYFDTRLNTETLQRLGDQTKIQTFITWKSIELFLNILNILVFGGILFYYSKLIFIIYFIFSSISISWVLFFLKGRSTIEYAMFLKQGENNNNIYEFIMNMPEIKINNAQTKTINKILSIQNILNKLELRSLFLNTYQQIGVNVFSKIKELVAIAICAFFIIKGNMTIGVLLSVSYVIGQLSSPLQNIVSLIKDTQDASISNKRLGEIYNETDEDIEKVVDLTSSKVNTITVKNVSFKYPGNFNPFVLQNINIEIKANTVTAIVGASGSGKTTLLKLLLAYYTTNNGNIFLNEHNIADVKPPSWRNKCGIVLQDGQIYSATIADNISFSDEKIDFNRLYKALQIAAIDTFVDSLPMGVNTKVGNAGIQLSGGQKQRLLIARAVYKDPEFILLDEATSALDSENERIIHENLQEFFKNRTVIIIAHRLSTVKKADNIVVMKRGEITEIGSHLELASKRGDYYELVKNQLELGE